VLREICCLSLKSKVSFRAGAGEVKLSPHFRPGFLTFTEEYAERGVAAIYLPPFCPATSWNRSINYIALLRLLIIDVAFRESGTNCTNQDCPRDQRAANAISQLNTMRLCQPPDYQPQVLVLAVNTGGFHCILAGSIVLFGLVFCFSSAASCFLIRCVGSTILCSPL
jgi:hypothetical protein